MHFTRVGAPVWLVWTGFLCLHQVRVTGAGLNIPRIPIIWGWCKWLQHNRIKHASGSNMADLVVAGNQVQSRGVIHGFAPLKLEECKVALRGQKTTTFQKKKSSPKTRWHFRKRCFFVKCVLTTGTFKLTEVLSSAVAIGCTGCL